MCNKLVQHLRSSKTSVPNGDILDGLNYSQQPALLNLSNEIESLNNRRQRITPAYENFEYDDVPQTLGELFSICHSSPSTTSPSTIRPRPSPSTSVNLPLQRPERTFFLPNRQKSLKFLLDTGADENILNVQTAKDLGIPISSSPTGRFKTAGGFGLVYGRINLVIKIDECDRIFSFYIMNFAPNLIGWPMINEFKLLSECYIVAQPKLPVFPSSINFLLQKCCPTTPMRIANFRVTTLGNHSSPSTPIQASARPLSALKLNFLNSFIQKMKTSDVIEKGVSGDFLSPVHLVPKYDEDHRPLNQQFRCTVDMSAVNSTFSKLPCPIPSAPTTAASLASYKNKIVVDIKDGYFHVEVPEPLRRYFGVISKIGIFRFKRLIQGFINSPTIFQTMMLEAIDFPLLKEIIHLKLDADVLTFLDDIGAGTNDNCPYSLLAMILQKCVDANLTVLPSSIQIGPEVVHLGKLLTKRCEISIADRHREAIRHLPLPNDPDTARRCLAFLNYFREFVPNFASSTSQLRLLANKKPFNIQCASDQFNTVKECLVDSLPLRPVPLNSSLLLFADFSLSGIGGAVFWTTSTTPTPTLSKFASRSLKEAETRCPAIEAEATASLWIVSECHADILKASTTTVFTDHQPLVGALKNFSPEAPFSPRLSRLLGKLRSYNVEFKYLDGKHQIVADYLSRAHKGRRTG